MKPSRKPDPIPWTLYLASLEFGHSRETIARRLNQIGEKPKGGFYTTRQICRAIYSDLESERLRKTKEEADEVEMRNAERRGEVVCVEEFAKILAGDFIKIKQIVKSSKLDEESQFALGKQITKILATASNPKREKGNDQ